MQHLTIEIEGCWEACLQLAGFLLHMTMQRFAGDAVNFHMSSHQSHACGLTLTAKDSIASDQLASPLHIGLSPLHLKSTEKKRKEKEKEKRNFTLVGMFGWTMASLSHCFNLVWPAVATVPEWLAIGGG